MGCLSLPLSRLAASASSFVVVCAFAQSPRPGFAPELPAAPSGGPVKGARYIVDPTHTFVTYEIGHYGTTTNRGRFSTREGFVQIDAGGIAGRADVTMDMSSINTGVDLLNRHLQSKDFLDVAAYPTGRFVVDRFPIIGVKMAEVSGMLTLLGKTLPVTLKTTRFNCYQSPVINRQVCGGDFETVVQRSQWGITWGLQFGFEDQVHLLVQVEAVNVTDGP